MTEKHLKIVSVDFQNRNFPFAWQQKASVNSPQWQGKNKSISESKLQLSFHSANILDVPSVPLKWICKSHTIYLCSKRTKENIFSFESQGLEGT